MAKVHSSLCPLTSVHEHLTTVVPSPTGVPDAGSQDVDKVPELPVQIGLLQVAMKIPGATSFPPVPSEGQVISTRRIS